MTTNNRIKFISLFVVLYMILALTWWAILLNRQNNEVFDLQYTISQSESLQDIKINDQNIDIPELNNKHERQKIMIWGEGIVFGLALIIGIYLIYRAFLQELKISYFQKNFLLSVTHEFKTPLAAIKLSLDTLKNRQLEKADYDMITSNAKDEANRLESLVNNILMTTKLESKYQFNFEKLELNELIEIIANRMRNYFSTVLIEINCPESLFIEVDREAFSLLLSNLLDNAIKYSPDDTRIVIDCMPENGYVTIRVKDQGEGIPIDEKKLVFTKFYRVGSEETRKTKGTGIGLYLVKFITDAHKGKILVLDNKPNGTIIQIKLPIKHHA